MPITGVAIQTIPQKMEGVYESLQGMEGVSLYGHDQKGNIIAVFDTKNKQELDDLSNRIESIEGVIKVMGVYHHFEDEIPQSKNAKK